MMSRIKNYIVLGVIVLAILLVSVYFMYGKSQKEYSGPKEIINVNQENSVLKKYKTIGEIESSPTFKNFFYTESAGLKFKGDVLPHTTDFIALGAYRNTSGKVLFVLEKENPNLKEERKDKLVYDTLEVDPNLYCSSCEKTDIIATICNYDNLNYEEYAVGVFRKSTSTPVYQAWHVNKNGQNFEKVSDLEKVKCTYYGNNVDYDL